VAPRLASAGDGEEPLSQAHALPNEDYYLNVNIARGLLAAFETATRVWDYPDDDAIRCRPVTAPVRMGDDGLVATFDLFLPDGRSAEVDMTGTRPKGSTKVVWALKQARFFLPCQCGRVHRELEIGEDGVAHRNPVRCRIMAPVRWAD
jgi:hypothetical protein